MSTRIEVGPTDVSAYLKLDQTTPQSTVGKFTFPNLVSGTDLFNYNSTNYSGFLTGEVGLGTGSVYSSRGMAFGSATSALSVGGNSIVIGGGYSVGVSSVGIGSLPYSIGDYSVSLGRSKTGYTQRTCTLTAHGTTLTISGDVTSEFASGDNVLFLPSSGVDPSKTGLINTISYSSPNTTITIFSPFDNTSTSGYLFSTTKGKYSTGIGNNILVTGQYSVGIGLSTATPSTITANNVFSIMGGNVGIGSLSPSALFCIGSSNALTVDDPGNISTTGTLSAGTSTFTNVIDSGLTASKVVFSNGSKQLTSTGIGTSSQFLKGDGSLDSSSFMANPMNAVGDIIYGGTAGAPTKLAGNSTATRKFLRQGGSGGWQYYKSITISHTNVASTLSNFPVLVKITADSDLSVARNDGYDIRFYASDQTTILNYDRESWSGGGGSTVTATFWVQVPSISSSVDTVFYIYYGNAAATSDWPNTGSPTPGQSTWDTNFKGVWHFGSTITADSTANGNNATNHGVTSTTGKVGTCGNFNGSSYMDLGMSGMATGDSASSEFCWIQTSSTRGGIFEYGASSSYQLRSLVLGIAGVDGKIAFSGYNNDYNTNQVKNDNAWHYVGYVYSGSKALKVFIDGTWYTTTLGNNCNTTATYHRVGLNFHDSLYVTGLIDELRFSNSARADGWYVFEYYNMSSGNNEITFGTQTSNGGVTSAAPVWDTLLYADVPSGILTPPAGTATAGTAPLKFTSGTNLTTAEAGATEYNGTNLFFTRAGTTRENVLVAVDNASAPSTSVGVAIVNYYGSSATNFLGTPNRWISVNILGSVYKIPLYT